MTVEPLRCRGGDGLVVMLTGAWFRPTVLVTVHIPMGAVVGTCAAAGAMTHSVS